MPLESEQHRHRLEADRNIDALLSSQTSGFNQDNRCPEAGARNGLIQHLDHTHDHTGNEPGQKNALDRHERFGKSSRVFVVRV